MVGHYSMPEQPNSATEALYDRKPSSHWPQQEMGRGALWVFSLERLRMRVRLGVRPFFGPVVSPCAARGASLGQP